MENEMNQLTRHLRNIELYGKFWGKDPHKRPTIDFILDTLNKITWRMKSIDILTPSENHMNEDMEGLNSSPVNISLSENSFPLNSEPVYEIYEEQEFLEKVEDGRKRIVRK